MGIRNSDVTKASPNIHANESKAGGSIVSQVYLIEVAVWPPPPPPPHLLSPLPIVCLNFEQTIAGISISIHFRTAVANYTNFQTHPVCNLLSTNEINPSENIFNNNVMQNGISKIVKSWRFLLKSGRLQPHYIDAGGIIYVDTPIYSHTTWHRRIAVIVQKGPSNSRQIWCEAGFFDRSEGIYGGGGLIRI